MSCSLLSPPLSSQKRYTQLGWAGLGWAGLDWAGLVGNGMGLQLKFRLTHCAAEAAWRERAAVLAPNRTLTWLDSGRYNVRS